MSIFENPGDFGRVVIGTAGDDLFFEPRDTIDDILFDTRGGNDAIRGGLGDDVAHGGAGDDVFFAFAGNDRFDGDGGNDTYDATGLGEFLVGRFVFQAGGVIQKGTNLGVDIIGRFALNPDGSIAEIMPIENIWAPAGRSDNLIDLRAPTGNARAEVDLDAKTITIVERGTDARFTVDVANFQDITGTRSNDRLLGNEQTNEIFGGAGGDVIRGRGGDDILRGNGGRDVVHGDGGDDDIRGNAGNDRLAGGDGNDVVLGGSGDDVLVGGTGDDRLVGGSGFDKVDYSGLDAPITFATGGRLIKGAEGVLGTDLLGSTDPFRVFEVVIGDPDEINTLDNSGGNSIRVEVDLGCDRLVAVVEEDIIGIPGVEDLPAGTTVVVEVRNFTNVVGTDRFGDDLFGDADDNLIIGGGGADDIHGRAGNDTLVGESGADKIRTGSGLDTVVLTDTTATDRVLDFDPIRDAILVAIVGVASATTQRAGQDLDVVVDDGGQFDGAVLATLAGRAAADGMIDLDIGPFSVGDVIA